jgi:hypothetical protein
LRNIDSRHDILLESPLLKNPGNSASRHEVEETEAIITSYHFKQLKKQLDKYVKQGTLM